MNMRRSRRILLACSAAYLLLAFAGGISLAELHLHPWRRPLTHSDEAVKFVRAHYATDLDSVELLASDGVALRAWYVHPHQANGRDVLLLHGVGDNREGVAGFATVLLDHGYSVLLPDSRAHGDSGGELATYGIRESDDIHRWVGWLYSHQRSKCVYGFGESMGAALILESLGREDRFCAVIAESPFSNFRVVAYERAALYLKAPSWIGRTLLRLPVQAGISYAKLRYKLDLDRDNPSETVGRSSTPIFLIHGTDDIDILPHHSELIAQQYPSHVTLWEVPGATHCGASAVAPETFWNKVFAWLETHADNPRAASPMAKS